MAETLEDLEKEVKASEDAAAKVGGTPPAAAPAGTPLGSPPATASPASPVILMTPDQLVDAVRRVMKPDPVTPPARQTGRTPPAESTATEAVKWLGVTMSAWVLTLSILLFLAVATLLFVALRPSPGQGSAATQPAGTTAPVVVPDDLKPKPFQLKTKGDQK